MDTYAVSTKEWRELHRELFELRQENRRLKLRAAVFAVETADECPDEVAEMFDHMEERRAKYGW